MTRYIYLRKPTDLKLKSKQKEIRDHITNGCKTSEVLLECAFVAPDEVVYNLLNEFRVIKNQIALRLDTRFK